MTADHMNTIMNAIEHCRFTTSDIRCFIAGLIDADHTTDFETRRMAIGRLTATHELKVTDE